MNKRESTVDLKKRQSTINNPIRSENESSNHLNLRIEGIKLIIKNNDPFKDLKIKEPLLTLRILEKINELNNELTEEEISALFKPESLKDPKSDEIITQAINKILALFKPEDFKSTELNNDIIKKINNYIEGYGYNANDHTIEKITDYYDPELKKDRTERINSKFYNVYAPFGAGVLLTLLGLAVLAMAIFFTVSIFAPPLALILTLTISSNLAIITAIGGATFYSKLHYDHEKRILTNELANRNHDLTDKNTELRTLRYNYNIKIEKPISLIENERKSESVNEVESESENKSESTNKSENKENKSNLLGVLVLSILGIAGLSFLSILFAPISFPAIIAITASITATSSIAGGIYVKTLHSDFNKTKTKITKRLNNIDNQIKTIDLDIEQINMKQNSGTDNLYQTLVQKNTSTPSTSPPSQ